MGLLDFLKETWRLNKAYYESESQTQEQIGTEDKGLSAIDEIATDPHAGEELITYNGVTFWDPKPITNVEYQKIRRLQADWLEHHYDLTSSAGIMSIPTKNPPKAPFGDGVTGDIDYYLHSKAHIYEEDGKIDLAILCMKKSNAIRKLKYPAYGRETFYDLVKMLARNGRVEEAYTAKEEVDTFFEAADANFTSAGIKRILAEAKAEHTDLLIMDPHGASCPECAKFQGRVFSISVTSKMFPKIPSVFFELGKIHPGCGHGFYPYIHGVTDPRLDYTLSFQTAVKRKYRKDIIAFSNRPFVDDRLPEDIARAEEIAAKAASDYERQQNYYEHMIEDEVKRSEEAKAFEWLQQNLPAICPKSLSGFRRMKKQNTKNYQKIVAEARKLGYEI